MDSHVTSCELLVVRKLELMESVEERRDDPSYFKLLIVGNGPAVRSHNLLLGARTGFEPAPLPLRSSNLG